MVKSLDYNFGDFFRALNKEAREHNTTEILSILTKLLFSCLPNLEEIIYCFRDLPDAAACSYLPVINALQNSQLKRLDNLYPPPAMGDSEIANYDTCVMLMKDRIKEIFITSEGEAENTPITSNYLYNNLHQFDKPDSLEIEIEINDIEILDRAIESCKFLKNFTFEFGEPDKNTNSSAANNSMIIDPLTAINPTYKMESVDAYVFESINIHKLILYMTQKFPELPLLKIEFFCGVRIDHIILDQLLHFSSTIDNFEATHLLIDNHVFVQRMSEYCKAKSKPGVDTVTIIYTNDLSADQPSLFHISRKKDEMASEITCTYSAFTHDWKYMEYIEKNGIYISKLNFKFKTIYSREPANCHLPENFMSHTLTYCPNLQYLCMDNCILKQRSYSSIDFRKNLSLEELSLIDCTVYPGVFEQLSVHIPKIKLLRLDGLSVRTNERTPPTTNRLVREKNEIEIVMVNTEIDEIVFMKKYADKTNYLKVFSLKDRDYRYYRFGGALYPSIELEYLIPLSNLHIHICCQTNPLIKFVT